MTVLHHDVSIVYRIFLRWRQAARVPNNQNSVKKWSYDDTIGIRNTILIPLSLYCLLNYSHGSIIINLKDTWYRLINFYATQVFYESACSCILTIDIPISVVDIIVGVYITYAIVFLTIVGIGW